MIYTGYFAQAHKYLEAGLILLSVANKCPESIKAIKIPWLTPGSWIYKWKQKCEQIGKYPIEMMNEYIDKYTKDKLNNLSPKTVFEKLNALVDHHDAILLCYEKLPEDYVKDLVDLGDLEPGKTFCHRHIISNFLQDDGFECREYLIRKQHQDEGGLF
jgi:hypothetical protein